MSVLGTAIFLGFQFYTTLRIIKSQVTCVLEIPEPCYIDSTPSFFGRSFMILRVYTLKVLLSTIFWMVLNRKNPLFAGSGFSSSTIPGDSSAKNVLELGPEMALPSWEVSKTRTKGLYLVGCFCWGGWKMEKGGMECFLFFWMVASTCSSWWFQPPWKNMSQSLKPPKDKGHEPRKPWH